MDTINSILINGGEAILWLWASIKFVAVHAWSWVDAILNPVLSPALRFLNPWFTRAGDAVYALLSPLPVWAGLTILSAVAGVLMLVVFGKVSNQKAISRVKDDIKANLLALKLFKDELRVTFGAQGRLFWAVCRLQGHMLLPVLIMILPMMVVLAQMAIRYQWRPLRSGEPALIRMNLPDGFTSSSGVPRVTLQPNGGIDVEAAAVPGADVLVWRVRAADPGRHTLVFDVEGSPVEKELVVGEAFQRVSAERPPKRWTHQLLHPVERPMSSTEFTSIEIDYPGVDSWIYGQDWWVLYFFIVSMLFAFLFKPIFKIKF